MGKSRLQAARCGKVVLCHMQIVFLSRRESGVHYYWSAMAMAGIDFYINLDRFVNIYRFDDFNTSIHHLNHDRSVLRIS